MFFLLFFGLLSRVLRVLFLFFWGVLRVLIGCSVFDFFFNEGFLIGYILVLVMLLRFGALVFCVSFCFCLAGF